MKKKLLIFDLDGTLYELEGGSYNNSLLKKTVLANAKKYLINKLEIEESEAQKKLDSIINNYDENISLGFEKKFNLDRYDYFNVVWNISANNIVKSDYDLHELLNPLTSNYNFALVSDAADIWINNVLEELKIKDLFVNNIFSGEGNRRKGFGNAFKNIITNLNIKPENCISIGDQEYSDIIPAQELGMKTIFVHPTKKSEKADVNIKSIKELPQVI